MEGATQSSLAKRNRTVLGSRDIVKEDARVVVFVVHVPARLGWLFHKNLKWQLKICETLHFQRAFETNSIQYTYGKQKNKMGNNASTVGIDDSSAIAAPTTNGSEKEYLGMYWLSYGVFWFCIRPSITSCFQILAISPPPHPPSFVFQWSLLHTMGL